MAAGDAMKIYMYVSRPGLGYDRLLENGRPYYTKEQSG